MFYIVEKLQHLNNVALYSAFSPPYTYNELQRIDGSNLLNGILKAMLRNGSIKGY